MAQAGDDEVNGTPYPRMQLLTIPDILEGWRFNTPGVVGRKERVPMLPGATAYREQG